MIYVKIMSGGEIVGAEAIDNPAYVKYQTRNKVIVRCSEFDAQGILSKDGSEIYQLQEKEALPGEYRTSVPISMAEFDELGYADNDTEDTDPVVPGDTDEAEILTRAELTAKVKELEETNTMLMECLLEMSEAVYA